MAGPQRTRQIERIAQFSWVIESSRDPATIAQLLPTELRQTAACPDRFFTQDLGGFAAFGSFRAIGYDRDERKVEMLQKGQTYLHHLGTEMVTTLAGSDRFEPTCDPTKLADADAMIL